MARYLDTATELRQTQNRAGCISSRCLLLPSPHLHEELPANNHGLKLRVVDVGGDDGPPPRDLGAHKLRVHFLTGSTELHLLCDDPLLGVILLSDALVTPGQSPGNPLLSELGNACTRRAEWI
jgi:hypothetical protein